VSGDTGPVMAGATRFTCRRLEIGEEACDFWLGQGRAEDVADIVSTVDASRYLVVCDATVRWIHGDAYRRALAAHAPTTLLVHAPDEGAKTLATVEVLGNEAIRRRADRSTAVIALGGGLTGNIAGLLASLLYRGVPLVHVPTTLLAMVDSVVSRKQAVNSGHGKNAFGTYRQPELIVANTTLLETLAPVEVQSGLCEIIKNALAIDPGYLDQLLRLLRPDARYASDELTGAIEFALCSKQDVLREDPCERDRALVCEYGHTLGHAIEYCSGVPHGLAVGVGMLAAAEVAYARADLPRESVDLHYELMARNGGLDLVISRLRADEVISAVGYDNKRGTLAVGADELPMVLLEKLGRAQQQPSGVPLVPVRRDEVTWALHRSTEKASAIVTAAARS
jgi:3-dehydroquinate synthetase